MVHFFPNGKKYKEMHSKQAHALWQLHRWHKPICYVDGWMWVGYCHLMASAPKFKKPIVCYPILKISQPPVGLSVIILFELFDGTSPLLCQWLDVHWILVDVPLMASTPKFKEAHSLLPNFKNQSVPSRIVCNYSFFTFYGNSPFVMWMAGRGLDITVL